MVGSQAEVLENAPQESPCAFLSLGAELLWAPSALQGTGIPGRLELTDATEAALRSWLASAQGEPAGVAVGHASATAPRSSVRSVCRLLGLSSLHAEETLRREGAACGAELARRPEATEPAGIEARLVVPHGEGEEVNLTPAELLALLLGCCAHRFATPEGRAASLAAAVPSWWGPLHRRSVASATALAGLSLRRLASRPLCAAVGLFARLPAEPEPREVERRVESIIEADYTDRVRCLILVADVDEDSIDAMLLEAEPLADEPKALWERASRETPPSCRWLLREERVRWRTLAAAGQPLHGAEDVHTEIEALTARVLADADCIGNELSGVVLVNLARSAPRVCGSGSGARVFRAETGDVAAGLAHIVASEADPTWRTRKNPARFIEALSEPVGIIVMPQYSSEDLQRRHLASLEEHAFRQLDDEDAARDPDEAPIDLVFKKMAALPVTTKRRFYCENYHSDLFQAFYHQDQIDMVWRRFQTLPKVLTVEDIDVQAGDSASSAKTYKKAESVLVQFQVDRSGIFSARVIASSGSVKPNKLWLRIVIMILLICAVITVMFNDRLRLQWRNMRRTKLTFDGLQEL